MKLQARQVQGHLSATRRAGNHAICRLQPEDQISHTTTNTSVRSRPINSNFMYQCPL